MPTIETTPTTTAPCWSCKQVSPTHVLPDVRLMHCPNSKCGVLLPGESEEDFAMRKTQFNLPIRKREKI